MNNNQKRRDEIIDKNFLTDDYRGGIRRFDNINAKQLGVLIKEDFADKKEKQNRSPSIGRLYNLAKKFKKISKCYFSGYTVDKSRPDYRTSIDEITIIYDKTDNATIDLLLAIADISKDADEVNFNENNPPTSYLQSLVGLNFYKKFLKIC